MQVAELRVLHTLLARYRVHIQQRFGLNAQSSTQVRTANTPLGYRLPYIREADIHFLVLWLMHVPVPGKAGSISVRIAHCNCVFAKLYGPNARCLFLGWLITTLLRNSNGNVRTTRAKQVPLPHCSSGFEEANIKL